MKEKILEILCGSGGYVSGEELSRRLGISRAAVWKHIKRLRDEGYVINSVTNRGYRMESAPDVITEEAVSAGLDTKYVGRVVHCFSETDSTNEEAKRHSGEPDGTIFISEAQTAGKGRLGRAWQSPRGVGVWMTLLLKPDIAPAHVSEITLIAGLAVCRAIGGGARIKWPNDIVIGSKKVCGILTEMSAEVERINYVVCGIGINANTVEFPEELRNRATSIFIESGREVRRAELAAAAANEFEPIYEAFKRGGFAALRDEYKRLCVTLGRGVQVTHRGKTIVGTARDITPGGALVVSRGEESVEITSGEVSVRGIYGYI